MNIISMLSKIKPIIWTCSCNLSNKPVEKKRLEIMVLPNFCGTLIFFNPLPINFSLCIKRFVVHLPLAHNWVNSVFFFARAVGSQQHLSLSYALSYAAQVSPSAPTSHFSHFCQPTTNIEHPTSNMQRRSKLFSFLSCALRCECLDCEKLRVASKYLHRLTRNAS